MDIEATFSEAMKAIEANEHARARDLLIRVVKANPRHEEGWLWLAGVVDNLDQSIDCLNRVLSLNPGNAKAKEWLSFAQQEKTKEAPPAPVTDADDSTRAINRLGAYLLRLNFITAEQLERALQTQRQSKMRGEGKRLGAILIEQGAITQERLDYALNLQQTDYNSSFRD